MRSKENAVKQMILDTLSETIQPGVVSGEKSVYCDGISGWRIVSAGSRAKK